MILRNAKKDVFKRILALAAIIFWIILPSNCVRAVSGDGLIAYPTNADPDNSLSQSWFIYDLNPGESKEDYLTVKNDSDQEQSIKIYAVDSTTNNMGGFALEEENDIRDSIGKWIIPEVDHMIIKPRQEQQVKFNISIPIEATAGEISGGIIIQKDLTEEQKNAKSGFVISTRIGIRVYETVPGETIRRASFSGGSVEHNKQDMTYVYSITVKNEGNISLDSTVKVNIKDTLLGKQNQTLEQKILVPRGEEQRLVFTLDKAKIGKFEASAELTYKNNDGTEEKISNPEKMSFYAFPQEYIPIIGLFLLVNLIYIILLKLKRRINRKYYKEYTIQSGDNLENIAERTETSWKKIAKINKLKPPYQLEEGQTITIVDKKDVMSSIFSKSEVLSEPTERIRQDRQKAFEEDLSLISDEKNISSDKKRFSTGRQIFKKLLLLIIIAALGYFIYNGIIAKKNNANFVYNRGGNQIDVTNEDQSDEPQTSTATKNTETIATDETATGDKEISNDTTSEATIGEIGAADRQEAKIEILNGSGVKGASGTAAAAFEVKGYAKITTGNADRFNYANTTIECGSNTKSAICQEAKSIIASIPYTSIEDKECESANTDKIIITLGK